MQRNLILFLMAVLLLGSFLGSHSTAFAQSASTGAIGGAIADQNGATLSGATVTVTNIATTAVRTAVTSKAGDYRITELEPGTYTLVVTANGFETYREMQVPVTVGGVSEISPRLTVGNVKETVEVTDQAPMLHTDSSDISSVIDQTQIDNL